MMGRMLERAMTLGATLVLCAGLYVAAGMMYEHFFSLRVFTGFFGDAAILGVVAVGMTFVILSGGIDLSVGAVVACASILIGSLVSSFGWHPLPAMLVTILAGMMFGVGMGSIIHFFEVPAFIVTLAGMFFARGMAFMIGEKSIAINHPFMSDLSGLPYTLSEWLGLSDEAVGAIGLNLPVTGVIFVLTVVVASFVLALTPFGRHVYAIGGDEDAARLMGLPVARTKVTTYAISGACGALGGAVYTLYTFSGNTNAGLMLELDAIAAVVIGGTLLTGGVGWVGGTVLGVLIFAIIRTAITFDGSLSSWWARIAIGVILLGFILFQRGLQRLLGLDRLTSSD